jgi:hypothetical protein
MRCAALMKRTRDTSAAPRDAGYPSTVAGGHAMNAVGLESTLTCPACHHSKIETMPNDACQWFHGCEGCHTVLRPTPGDCCVYCSDGTVPCPPVQEHGRQGGCCG